MAVIKCKMCGGDLDISEGLSVCECEYCGTKQTVPTVDDEKKITLFNRAGRLLRGCEFDKAAGIFESIVADFPEEAEAYWGLVLCKFGIEYVDDPATGKKVPTCHRSGFDSVMKDADFEQACENADGAARRQYREEAKTIEELRRSIIEVSGKEEPYDIFICYKETDENGNRTIDSVLAQDVYDALTEKGYRVFFSRITLEDKLGQEYEPYIFAALNSAKIMLAFGTDFEYYNAVWVKNEWSRFLKLMSKDKSKHLIPCYKNIDAYDMPEEFARLQAQDMGKVGAVQDLLRGIEKLLPRKKEEHQPQTVVQQVVQTAAGPNVAALLKRAFMYLEDGEWQNATEYCERVLDEDPENARAYLSKLMAELHVRKQEKLADCKEAFDGESNYQKAVRFGDEKLASALNGYIAHINDRNTTDSLMNIYRSAVQDMGAANSEEAYLATAAVFQTISDFKDAEDLTQQCLEMAEISRKDAIYSSAKAKMTTKEYEKAVSLFETIPGWKDADGQIDVCHKGIELAKIESLKTGKKKKRIVLSITTFIIACVAFVVVLLTIIIPNNKYNSAMDLYNNGKFEEALVAFKALNGRLDSKKMIEKCYMGIIGENHYNLIKDLKVGETLKYGKYEQDNVTSNGKEEIEWIVLDREGMSLLLISRYALNGGEYHYSYNDVTWETCSLRRWLNNTFIDDAFSTTEQMFIHYSHVSADMNLTYLNGAGSSTNDRLFLLSIPEANKYFNSSVERKCTPTKYATAQGVWTSDANDTGGVATCWWWLRTPGDKTTRAAVVDGVGQVYEIGHGVDYDDCGIRPAMWISLEP